jgi:uncharacterized protein (TIGR03000 family)
MYKSILSVFVGLLAAGAFALTPGTALAQHRGGGGRSGHSGGGGNWNGGRGGNWNGGRGGNWNGGRGDWHDGRGRGWGWGGVGIGIGLGYPGYGYGGYGSGYYGYSRPYYYGDSGGYYDTTPYYNGAPSYDYSSAPAYGDRAAPDYAYDSTARDTSAQVRVIVPPDAKVWFNDRLTKQTGSERDFASPALTPGRDFSYDVKAQWRDENGKEVTRTRHVDVRANANVTVDFTTR